MPARRRGGARGARPAADRARLAARPGPAEEPSERRGEGDRLPRIGLIGVPTSAASHSPGQEKGPAALRRAGLVERLEEAGLSVVDHGDLPLVRWTPDKVRRTHQNLPTVVAVAARVADRAAAAFAAGQRPLVVGGDCTIELGVLAGALGAGLDPALLYFDAHADLNTPASVREGALDWMGMAHALGLPEATPELSRFGPRVPLLADEQVVYFATVPFELTAWERETMARRSLRSYPVAAVAADPRGAAAAALADVEARGERFLVHFDVDAIDFVDFPIADYPQLNAGLAFRDAMTCLGVFAASPKFAGLTITEVNPDHADEDGALTRTFVAGIARALAGG
jgi:arginase